MFGTSHIRKHERGLWFQDGDFHKLLMPGEHRIGGRLWSRRNAVQIVSVLETSFTHQLLDLLIEEEGLREELLVLDLNDNQRALVWKGDSELETYVRYCHPSIRTGYAGGSSRSKAYEDGIEAGRSVTLRRPIRASKGGFGGFLTG